MITMIVIIAFAILFYIGYQFYQFDNSPFAKETGYNYFDSLTNGKIKAQKMIYDHASKVKAKVLLNVQIDEATHQNFADAIVIHSSALYVVMLRDKNGWISGTDKSYEWIEQLHGGKVNKFANPVHENMRMSFAILDLMPELDKHYIESVIAFSNGCSFQRVELHSNTVEILKYNELARWMDSLVGDAVAKDEQERIFTTLKKFSIK